MRALHIATGDQAAAFLFDAWLNRYSAEIERVSDVFDACVRMLQSPEKLPDLILLGGTLADDEQLLIRYLIETWPGAIILHYGQGGAAHPIAAPWILHVESQTRRNEILSSDPAHLVQNHAGVAEMPEPLSDNAGRAPDSRPRIADKPDIAAQSTLRRTVQVRASGA